MTKKMLSLSLLLTLVASASLAGAQALPTLTLDKPISAERLDAMLSGLRVRFAPESSAVPIPPDTVLIGESTWESPAYDD